MTNDTPSPQPLTIAQVYTDLRQRLINTLGEREAAAAAIIILEDLYGITPTDLAVNGQRSLEPESANHIQSVSKKITEGEPVQYAVGSARFYGLDFKVNPSVLIPRPETEGLVDLIVDDCKGRSDLNILDCGTGSGCIAISLARTLRFAKIKAIDISTDAVKVAEENARRLKASVNFQIEDIFNLSTRAAGKYDVIVSNPPYIAISEKETMDKRVKEHEPSLALFVPDDDPLEYYKAIGAFAIDSLSADGKLYFEINPRFTTELSSIIHDLGFHNVRIERDYVGKYRYLIASYI